MERELTKESYQVAMDAHTAGLKKTGLNTGPHLDVLEVRDWLRLGEYSGNAYSIDVHRDDLLFYMATNYWGDFSVWIEGRFFEEDWSDWPPERKSSWIALIELYWRCQFEFPITIMPTWVDGKGPCAFKKPESWNELYASRFFSLAEELDIISETFFEPLFSASKEEQDRFLVDCLFASRYVDEFTNPTKPWSTYLPTEDFVIKYLEDGFFRYKTYEKEASDAHRKLKWDYWNGKT